MIFDINVDGEYKEVFLDDDECSRILSKRASLSIFNDKIDGLLNEQELSDSDFGRITRAYFEMRLHGIVPDFSDDRFLRKVFEMFASGDSIKDSSFIKQTLRNRANGKRGGRPRKNKSGESEETEEP